MVGWLLPKNDPQIRHAIYTLSPKIWPNWVLQFLWLTPIQWFETTSSSSSSSIDTHILLTNTNWFGFNKNKNLFSSIFWSTSSTTNKIFFQFFVSNKKDFFFRTTNCDCWLASRDTRKKKKEKRKQEKNFFRSDWKGNRMLWPLPLFYRPFKLPCNNKSFISNNQRNKKWLLVCIRLLTICVKKVLKIEKCGNERKHVYPLNWDGWVAISVHI